MGSECIFKTTVLFSATIIPKPDTRAHVNINLRFLQKCLSNAASVYRNIPNRYCMPRLIGAGVFMTWAFISTASPPLNIKKDAFHPGSRQEGNQQRVDMDIEAEQLTLTFWYGPTRKRWWTYLSTRLVFPTLSFPSITTLASTRIALIVTGFEEAQDATQQSKQEGGS